MSVPPPPRPSSLPPRQEGPPAPKRPRFVIRWAAVGTATVALAVGVVVGMGLQFQVDHAADSTPLPPCTDRIADAGGMCEGPLLPECETEDSDNCAWDATVQGNGQGRSFYVIDGKVTYTGQSR